jgi:hypothetical protein
MIKSSILLFLFMGATHVSAQHATEPKALTCPFPTLENLAVEWEIAGDDNLNCRVQVSYRIRGEMEWNQGMDLFRVPAGKNIGFTWKNKLSGSLFGLRPNTGYEIRLILEDPDGGQAEETVYAKTRPVPAITAGTRIITIQPGVYHNLVTENGTPEHPVAYVCKEGAAIYSHIDLVNRKWVMLVGLTVENPEKEGNGICMNGAENCAVIGCNVQAVYGIVGYKPGITNCYISDNTLNGICPWTNRAMGAHGENLGEGIEITGPGNVICYNRVTGFRDCISTMEDQHVVNQTCIDIYGNDIYRGVDDAVEADFCFSNCRIYNNRITNCFVGLSSQPGLGGPNYFFRNSMYNITHGAFKLKRFSQGDVVMHNTVVKAGAGLGGNDSMDFAWFRNNLAIGGVDGGVKWGDYGAGRPSAADIIKPRAHCSFDYDAVGVYGISYIAWIGNSPFASVETHGMEGVTLENLFNGVTFPYPPIPEKPVQDLRLKAGAKVIDQGIRIPNINDGYTGAAPDIGAYEFGQELPHYGPRDNNPLLKQ